MQFEVCSKVENASYKSLRYADNEVREIQH